MDPLAPTTARSERDYDGDEWTTPSHVLDLTRAVLGRISLDPASSAFAQQRVSADRFFTKADGSLDLPWLGESVWLNPPYSNPRPFVDKLRAEVVAGNVGRALLLVNTSSSTGWFQALVSQYPTCLWRSRIRFVHPQRSGDRPRYDSTFVYLGDGDRRFAEVFGPYGAVVRPWDHGSTPQAGGPTVR